MLGAVEEGVEVSGAGGGEAESDSRFMVGGSTCAGAGFGRLLTLELEEEEENKKGGLSGCGMVAFPGCKLVDLVPVMVWESASDRRAW